MIQKKLKPIIASDEAYTFFYSMKREEQKKNCN